MARAADIPIIGGVLQSFSLYFSRSAKILRHPFGFVRSINFEDRAELKKAYEFLFASIIVAYMVCVPALLKHESDDFSQPLFIFSHFIRMFLVAVMMHIALKVLRSRKPLRSTFIAYCHTAGLSLPLMVLLGLPFVMVVGPEFAFGRMRDSRILSPDILRLILSPNAILLMNITSILFFVIGITAIIVMIVWLSRIHEMSILRAGLAVVIALFASLPIMQFVYYPLWDHVEGWLVNNVFRFL